MSDELKMDGLTAEQLRERVNARYAKNAERYREDELGLSMAADSIMARVDSANADILDAGGQWQFRRLRLQRLDGTPVDGRIVTTRYGQRWRVDEDDAWLPVSPARESTLAKRGYREVTEYEVGPAKAITWAPPGARGTGGMTQVRVIIIRTDRPAREGWVSDGAPE
jgi:hypothetical protein